MRKGLLILALALGLGLVAGILAHRRPPQELLLEGRTLKAWTFQAYTRDPKAETVLETAGAKCVPGLLRLLRARDSWSRAQLLKLSPLLPRSTRAQLFKRLPAGSAVRTREAAAHALGLLGDQSGRTIPALATALRDPEGRVCWEAASALARLGPPGVPALIGALHDKAAQMRSVGAFGLGESGASAVGALPPLSGLLDDPDARVRTTAAVSLVLIGTEASLLTNGVALPSDPLGRKNALRLRLQLDPSLPAYVTPLTTMAASSDPEQRRRGIELLASVNVANNAVIDALTNALTDPNPEVRLAACKGLVHLGARARPGIPLLISNLNDPGPLLRQSSAQALGAIGPGATDALPHLELLRSDAEPEVRTAATQALARIQRDRP